MPRKSTGFIKIALLAALFMFLFSGLAEAGTIKLKNKTNKTFIVSCYGQGAQFAPAAVVQRPDNWAHCQAVEKRLANGTLAIIP